MELPPLDLRKRAKEAFANYFSAIFDAETFERARRIFDELGAYNDRILAMQFHAAGYVGRIEDVLAAYEQAMDPVRGYLHLVREPFRHAAEVWMLSDVVFSNIIAGRDEETAWQVMLEVEAPDDFMVFDELYSDEVAPQN